ncbi:MAG: dihydrodipicolinate synthase family protein [Firmicutes bacterium]|nr:dihydrodipicolinate synthase family protein [Bacillota bacterium]
MADIKKYRGVFPAFYACYEDDGSISVERTRALAQHLLKKGVQGLYVGGSSGECIYQSVAERKLVLETVMEEVGDKMVIIAHVACNNTADSQELARHAESLNVDAIAAIPPIYFKLPPHGMAAYWNDISAAAPNTDFIIYNIPQLAGVSLTMDLLREMLKNPRVIGVKNSSMPTQDIEMWEEVGGEEFAVFNGPDEQFISGLAMGAVGGIGGTYGVMPELYLKIFELFQEGKMKEALEIQHAACHAIYTMCSAKGNLYAVMKEVMKKREGIVLGSVRKPLPALVESDMAIVDAAVAEIDEAIAKFC